MSVFDWLNKLVTIPGRLTSVAIEKVVCGADEVYDDELQKRQSELNAIFMRGVNEKSVINDNVTVEDTVADGEQKTLMFINDGAEELVVTVPNSSYKTPDGEAIIIHVPSGGYGEVSLLNIGGTIFARGC